jgi:hypothetical protein
VAVVELVEVLLGVMEDEEVVEHASCQDEVMRDLVGRESLVVV